MLLCFNLYILFRFISNGTFYKARLTKYKEKIKDKKQQQLKLKIPKKTTKQQKTTKKQQHGLVDKFTHPGIQHFCRYVNRQKGGGGEYKHGCFVTCGTTFTDIRIARTCPTVKDMSFIHQRVFFAVLDGILLRCKSQSSCAETGF